MRARFVCFLLISALIAHGDLVIYADEAKPTYEGSAKDDHGDINWKSTATYIKKEKIWHYYREVTNRSSKCRCRVDWEAGSIHSYIKPDDNVYAEAKMQLEPETKVGLIRYSGGEVAGKGKKNTQVWTPAGFSSSVVSKAKVFAKTDKVYPIIITANSKLVKLLLGKKRVMYEFSVVGPPEWQVDNKMFIEWDLPGVKNALKKQDKLVDGKYIRMQGGVCLFELYGKRKEDFRPREGVVKVAGQDRTVVAEAWLPAVAMTPAK